MNFDPGNIFGSDFFTFPVHYPAFGVNTLFCGLVIFCFCFVFCVFQPETPTRDPAKGERPVVLVRRGSENTWWTGKWTLTTSRRTRSGFSSAVSPLRSQAWKSKAPHRPPKNLPLRTKKEKKKKRSSRYVAAQEGGRTWTQSELPARRSEREDHGISRHHVPHAVVMVAVEQIVGDFSVIEVEKKKRKGKKALPVPQSTPGSACHGGWNFAPF